MRKQYASKIGRNKLLTLAIAATLVASVMTIGIPNASAAEPPTMNVGTGQGTIFYTAHRIPNSNWDPCFAETCDQGTGPGTWVWFVLFNDASEVVASGLSNEDGVLITGLDVGRTYYLQPTDCDNCNPGFGNPHDVKFNNWWDCDTTQQRPFVITSDTVSAAAYYRYQLAGENEPVPCYTVGNPGPPSGGGGSTGGDTGGSTGGGDTGGSTGGTTGGDTGGSTGGNNNNNNQPTSPGTVETGRVDPIFYFKMVGFLDNEFGASTIVAENGTEAAAQEIPDTNLSGQPLDSDPSLKYAEYNSLYEVIRQDPASASQIMRAAVDAGIPWEQLSDMQKAYIILKVKGSSMDATLVDLGLE